MTARIVAAREDLAAGWYVVETVEAVVPFLLRRNKARIYQAFPANLSTAPSMPRGYISCCSKIQPP